jgi:hypothetical protein
VLAAVFALVTIAGAGLAAEAPWSDDADAFHYEWRLTGFLGFFVRPFVPSRGDAVLRSQDQDSDRRLHQLHVTAPRTNHNDYWTYGSETERGTGQPLRVWSDYSFRGRSKRREKPVEAPDVAELAALIDRIRLEAPIEPFGIRLWWDGDIHEAEVHPRGLQQLPGDPREGRLYEVSGRGLPDSDLKGRLRLWLHPVEPKPLHMDFTRRAVRVRFRLVDGDSAPPDAAP